MQAATGLHPLVIAKPSHGLHIRHSTRSIHPRFAHSTSRPRTIASSTPDIDLDNLLGGLDIPEIEADLPTFQSEEGAVFSDDGIPLTFRNDGIALEALEKGVALIDLSHWGRLRLAGPGAQAFLHGQSTNDVNGVAVGAGCETVLTTPQARTIDLLTGYVQQSGVLVLTSPGMSEGIRQRFDKYIFPTDQVEVMDISPNTAMFVLAGPTSDTLLKQLQANPVVGKPWGTHTVLGISNKPVIIASGAPLSLQGYTLIVEESIAADLWKGLVAQGSVPMGANVFEIARVINGRPLPGKELTPEYNPLEAGLYHATSINKGCYVGQETISKVSNLNAVKQELWGLRVEAPVAVGDLVASLDGTKMGVVTSAVDVPTGGHRALAYLKCKADGARVMLQDKEVIVGGAGGVKGRVAYIPYATRSFPEETKEITENGGAAGVDEAEQAKQAAEKAAAEERRQAKLKAMQERLDAWTAQQQGQ